MSIHEDDFAGIEPEDLFQENEQQPNEDVENQPPDHQQQPDQQQQPEQLSRRQPLTPRSPHQNSETNSPPPATLQGKLTSLK